MSNATGHMAGAAQPRILFIPISGEHGTGEYYRALTIARSCVPERPQWDLHFLVNRHADVERAPGISFHELDGTPKRNQETVSGIIQTLRPDVVVLDSNLRKPMLAAARRAGARVVFTSWRGRTRINGFRIRHMPFLDEHWMVAPPEEQRLTPRERALSLIPGCPRPVFLSALITPPEAGRRRDFLREQGFTHENYVLFCSGGGGTRIDGQPAGEVFQAAARRFHRETGFPTVFISGPLSEVPLESKPGYLELRSAASENFTDLMAGARLMVSGGGSMLQQVLALGVACVAAPAGASDQPERVERCNVQGLIVKSAPDEASLTEGARRLLGDEPLQQRLREQGAAAGFRNSMDDALTRLDALIQGNT